MSRILLDELPIIRIGWAPDDSMPDDYYSVTVGNNGIDKIDAVEQNLGEYGICWLQVWREGVLVARYNAKNIDSISYEEMEEI